MTTKAEIERMLQLCEMEREPEVKKMTSVERWSLWLMLCLTSGAVIGVTLAEFGIRHGENPRAFWLWSIPLNCLAALLINMLCWKWL